MTTPHIASAGSRRSIVCVRQLCSAVLKSARLAGKLCLFPLDGLSDSWKNYNVSPGLVTSQLTGASSYIPQAKPPFPAFSSSITDQWQ